jgi:hypothetical protein
MATVGLVGRAQAQVPQPPIAFTDPDVTIAPTGEHTLTLLNNTADEMLVTVRVGPGDAVTTTASARQLRPGAAMAVQLTSRNAAPGSHGRVVAVAEGLSGGGVTRATFTVADTAGPAQPLVAEWSVTSYRFKPWGDASENEVLPLEGTGSCDEVVLPEGTVGGVTASPGAARVVGTCTTEGAIGGAAGVGLSFPGLAHHTGDYSGEIDLVPGDDEAGLVALVVRRTDYVLLPLAVLLLGVAAALVAARALRRLDTMTGDERDAVVLLAQVDDAHRTFRAAAGDAPWGGYTFKADADQRLRAVLRQLRDLGSGGGRRRAEAAGYPEAHGRLAAVRTAVAGWPLFPERLAALDAALRDLGLKASSHRPPTSGTNEPACVAATRPLLTGRRLTADEAVAMAAAVDDAATLTQGWLEWATTVAQLESRTELAALAVDELPADHPDHRSLADARARLSAVRLGLWEARDLPALREQGALDGIADARAMLDGLDRHAGDGARRSETDAEAPEPITPVLAVSALGQALAAGVAAGGQEASRGGARRRWRATIIVSGTAAVAAWSGLSALYFGQAFGSPRDYVGIFVWGFAAQALLGGLVATADRLGAGRAPAASAPIA